QAKLWLYGVARKVLANQWRTERRHAARTELLRDELAALPPQPAAPESGPVSEVFAGLSERDRELLALTVWEGLGIAEIAAVLGIPRSTVSLRLYRARRRFGRALQAAGITIVPNPQQFQES